MLSRRPRARRTGSRIGPRRIGGLAFLLLGLGACAQQADEGLELFEEPADAIAYETEIEGAPTDVIATLIEASIGLTRREEAGAQSLAFLRRRADGDVATIEKILRSYGYYEGTAEIRVTPGQTTTRQTDGGPVEETTPAQAVVTVAPGPPFTLTAHRLLLLETGGAAPDLPMAAEFGSPVGETAEAAGIVGAEQAAVRRLRQTGRPYARFRDRDAVADLEADTIEVDSAITTGPAYVFGPVNFEGGEGVERDFLRTYLTFAEGETFDVSKLSEYQNRLVQTNLFDGVSIQPPEEPPLSPEAPVTVRLDEAKHRTVSAGARFSTDDGPAVRLGFEHRNLFHSGERLELVLDASLDEQILDADFTKPQFQRDGQDLTAGLELRRIEEDAFDEVGATAVVGIQRVLSERWTVGAGLLGEVSQIDDNDGDGTALLAGLPLFVAYDSTDSDLDATRGIRSRLSATPFVGQFDDEFTTFLTLEGRASFYQDLLGDSRFVLAERARIGSIVADDLDNVPQTRRFYAGGGGSVRGFAQDFIGPIDDDNDPLGGLSVAEASLEFRAKVFGDIGTAVFVDAGVVGEDSLIDFSESVQVAAGVGLRYYSPIGPVRIDVAFPLDRRDDIDDAWQAYFSIGQAF